MLPVPQRIRKNWAVMGYLFGLVRQIDPDLKFAVDTFTLVGFLWFSRRFLGLICQLYTGKLCSRRLIIELMCHFSNAATPQIELKVSGFTFGQDSGR